MADVTLSSTLQVALTKEDIIQMAENNKVHSVETEGGDYFEVCLSVEAREYLNDELPHVVSDF